MTGLRLGNSANPKKDPVSEIETIREMGFDFVELTLETLNDAAKLGKKSARIKKALKRSGMFATAHAPIAVDLGHFYEPVRNEWLSQSKKIILLSVKTGIEKLNFHANYSSLLVESSELKEMILDNHVESFKKLVAAAKPHGVEILIENTTEPISDLEYVIDRVKGLGVNVDIGHAFIGGGDKAILNFIRTFKERLCHMHFHDNKGKRDDHLAIGQGKINFPLVVKELKRIGYDKTITFEVFTKNRAYVKYSLNMFRKLWSA